MASLKKGKGYSGSSAKSLSVGEKDWQKCHMKLEACKAEGCTDHIADLIDHLQKLNGQPPPNVAQLRKMAKALRVPQMKDGVNVDGRTLLHNVQRAFLAEVESLPGGGVLQPATSAVQRTSSSSVVSQPAASAADEFESPAVRQILQDVLEFGRLPKEISNPKSESAVAENKLAARVRKSNLRDRARAMLDRFHKCP